MDISLIYKLIFLLSAVLIVYAYEGFPVLLRIMAKQSRRTLSPSRDFRPSVTVLVPVYNEEKVILSKIRNCLALNYPRHLLEILICSDFSSDNTALIAKPFCDRGEVRFLHYGVRSGKTGVLNKSIPQATGEIIVLTDANTMLEPDSLLKLAGHYSSSKTGAVMGQVKLVVPNNAGGLEKEIKYREFETNLKYNEGLFGAAIGAFGGFYSIRKSLFKNLPPNAYSNDDLLIPMQILGNGYKTIFEPEAVSFEDTGVSIEEEFGRRIRIGAGNFQSFFLLLSMLNPLRFRIALFYFSHKVLRWFSPLLFILVLTSNILLANSFFFAVLLACQVFFYGMALAGFVVSRFKASVFPATPIYHFVSMNIALVLGFLRYIRGIKSAVWQSTGRAVS
jgi:cellulose synthase/poly-beta-1,6-N-acetylglucosamine synthase-like glycosyltransferase